MTWKRVLFAIGGVGFALAAMGQTAAADKPAEEKKDEKKWDVNNPPGPCRSR